MSGLSQSSFTAGDFARLCGVTKHTLYHYDQLGVFSPAAKGENGYRYYTAAQLEVFHVIAVLKELGMPLADIKAYLDRRSPEELVELLEREGRELADKIKRLQQMREMIRKKAALTRRAATMEQDGMRLTETPEEYLVMTPLRPLQDDRGMAVEIAAHVQYCEEHGIYSAYSIGSAVDPAQARREDLGAYTHFYTQVDAPPDGVPVYVKPAGSYLTACHTQGYVEVYRTYSRMLEEIEKQGWSISGPFYEDVLLDELSVQGYEEYLLKISIKVCKQENSVTNKQNIQKPPF